MVDSVCAEERQFLKRQKELGTYAEDLWKEIRCFSVPEQKRKGGLRGGGGELKE